MSKKEVNKELLNIPFGLGIENPFGEYFVGQSYLNLLHKDNLGVANVTFEAGCRNNWHIHKAKSGGGQILIITYGRGYYQEEGKEPLELLPGDFVYIPANVKHWHGASSTSIFAHISIEVPGVDTSTVWLEKVSDEDYLKANSCHKKPTTTIKQTAGRDELTGIADEFARLNDDVLFGEVWNRTEQLPIKNRCILTVIALVSSGITDSSLLYHIKNARNNGVSLLEISESLTHIAMYVGWPKIWAALRYVKEVYLDKK